MPATISASTTRILYKLMEIFHLDSESLYSAAGISKDDLMDVNKRISYQTLHHLWEQASELIDDPCFGLKGVEVWHPSDLNALGYAWLTSSTLRKALDRFQKFLKIATGFYRLELRESGDGYELVFDFLDKETLNMAQVDASMAIVMEMCRVNQDNNLSPIYVTFTHPKPDCQNQYFSYYGCPIEFGQTENKIVLPLDCIDKPLFHSNPALAFLNDKVMNDYMNQLNENDIAQKVKKIITEELSSGISREQIAERLHMSDRTLHRRLKESGCSFKKILQEVRIDLSKLYIRTNLFNATEIAFQLGFSDSSTFSRAFRRWTGSSPHEYKLNHPIS